ncbi:MAG: hypothetical protein NZ839_01280 [Endomicrobia bacterium]|nr:hypothetical protein [Endomicrobiia bacterium]MCX7716143.1 hypothetical protein [Endomicrobiia bacterium]
MKPKLFYTILLTISYVVGLAAYEFIQDGLFFDKNLNFITLKEILSNRDKIVVHTFSFEEPMWQEDIKSIRKYIREKIPLICINIDKTGYKYDFVNNEVFKTNNTILLFDYEGINTKFDFTEEYKTYIVYKNMTIFPVENYKLLPKYLEKQPEQQPFSLVNLLFTCGLKGMMTACPTCPDGVKTISWEQTATVFSIYKSKLSAYIFDLGNFLPMYPKKDEVKSIFYALVLSNYDGFIFGVNELLNLDKLFPYIIKENLFDKFILSQKWHLVDSQITSIYNRITFSEFKKIQHENDYSFLVIGLSPTTGHRNRVIVNTTDINKIREVIIQQKQEIVILLSNLTYIDDIELTKNIPEIKLVVNANHNYRTPQMMKVNNIPIFFPVCSPDWITKVSLRIENKNIVDIKFGQLIIPKEVKINKELTEKLKKILSSTTE